MEQSLVSAKYQIVMPKALLRKIKVKPGQRLNVELSGDKIILSPVSVSTKSNWPYDHLRILKNPWQGEGSEKYLEKERDSWD